MNVLFLANNPFNPKYGGVGRVTDILVKAFVKTKGYNIFYLCPKVLNRDMLDYVFPAKLFELPNAGNYDELGNKKFLLNLFEEYKIDIVVNQEGAFLTEIDFLEGLKQRCPVISVLHTSVDALYEHSQYEHRYANSRSFQKYIINNIKIVFWPLVKKMIKRNVTFRLKNHYNKLQRCSDAIVLLSDSYIPKFKEYVVDSTVAITAIPNPNTFDVQEIDYSIKEKIVLYVGRLNLADKNPIRLLQIWRELQNSHPDWRLVLVGGGPEEIALQKYIEKYQLRNVSLEGASQNVKDYYRRSSIVCLVSNYEGWGMTLTEGMTYGCVPFTFGNYGAAYDIIDDGVNGCIIPAFDIKHYARRLSEIMSDENKRLTMGQAAQDKVKQFSAENIVEQWDRLFNSL